MSQSLCELQGDIDDQVLLTADQLASAQRDLGLVDEQFPSGADRSVMHTVFMAGWINARILELAGEHRNECARGLCRSCHHTADMLSMAIAFDQAESELFKIDCELRELFPDLELVAALGDVRDPHRVAEVLER